MRTETMAFLSEIQKSENEKKKKGYTGGVSCSKQLFSMSVIPGKF